MPVPVFPTLPNGCVSEYPYGETDVFYVAQSYMPCGLTYTYKQNAAKKHGFFISFATLSETNLGTLKHGLPIHGMLSGHL